MRKLLAFAFILMLTGGCAQIQTRSSGQGSRKSIPGDTFEDDKRPDQDAKSEQQAQEITTPMVAGEVRKVAVVFGPGAAKTFTYPAVINALIKKRIPVSKVVGIEWGSLTAGFFALSGKPHEAEWKTFKFNPKDVSAGGLFSRAQTASVNALDDYLKENLTTANISDMALPFMCPALSLRRGVVSAQSNPLLWKAASNCLSTPPRITPNGEWVPAMLSLREIASSLKKEGYNTLILVNALGGANLFNKNDKDIGWSDRMYWLEVRRHIWAAKPYFTDVIEINTEKFSLFDFDLKKEMAAVGAKEGEIAADNIANKYSF